MHLAFSDICSRRIQASVTLHLMGKIRLQEGKPAEALSHIQEAVTMFKETGRHWENLKIS